MRICEYIAATSTKGIVMKPEATKGFEVYADADFSGGYMKGHTDDRNTAKSRSAYYRIPNYGKPVGRFNIVYCANSTSSNSTYALTRKR